MSVVVVGSVNMDVVARVPRIPRPGETLLATGATRGGGGKGANQAVAATRAGGAPTAFVGAVGGDGDGELLRTALADDGIDVSGIVRADAQTGTALISVGDDGENAIVVIPGANATLERLSAAQRARIAAADVVVAQLEVPVAFVLEAASARRAGALLVLNASPTAPLCDEAIARRVLEAVDVLVVNEHEVREVARAVGGDTGGLARAVDALAARVRAVVVTRGAADAILAVGSERRAVPAFRAEVVDTTGAGDTFCGVLAAHLAGGGLTMERLAAGARAGAAAAALAVGRPGAQAAVPAAAEVAGMLEDAP